MGCVHLIKIVRVNLQQVFSSDVMQALKPLRSKGSSKTLSRRHYNNQHPTSYEASKHAHPGKKNASTLSFKGFLILFVKLFLPFNNKISNNTHHLKAFLCQKYDMVRAQQLRCLKMSSKVLKLEKVSNEAKKNIRITVLGMTNWKKEPVYNLLTKKWNLPPTVFRQ